ncbi:MAG: hypothetical protein HEQ23_11355 [Tepidisphaera sp.]
MPPEVPTRRARRVLARLLDHAAYTSELLKTKSQIHSQVIDETGGDAILVDVHVIFRNQGEDSAGSHAQDCRTVPVLLVRHEPDDRRTGHLAYAWYRRHFLVDPQVRTRALAHRLKEHKPILNRLIEWSHS